MFVFCSPSWRACRRSKYADWISGPFQTGLPESEEVQAWPNTAHVNICPERHNLVLQLRGAAGALNLIARFAEQCYIVTALLFPIGSSRIRCLAERLISRALIGLRWILPPRQQRSRRSKTAVSGGCTEW